MKNLIEKYLGKLEESKFIVSIDRMESKYDTSNSAKKNVVKKEFDSEKEARKFMNDAMKKYKLVKHSGHIVNYSDDIELTTNF